MAPADAHLWITTADGTLGAAEDGAAPHPLAAPASAHRRLRGPYTGAGTVLRAVVPGALERHPDLVSAHEIELLSAAPELRRVIPATRETLTSLAVPKERTRFYSRMRTRRIAHGLAEFLRDLATREGGGRGLVLTNLEEADPTEAELLAVMLRRVPASVLRITAVTAAGAEPHPELAAALERYAVAAEGRPAPAATGNAGSAASYVAGECLAADPAARAAYEALDPAARAALHDARAAELAARDEPSLLLGAVPFHRALGSDRLEAVSAHLVASDWCIENGYYDATLELARRGLDLVGDEITDGLTDDTTVVWWGLTTKATMALAALDRADETVAIYDAARAATTSPRVHMHAAYATAMLYTRHLAEERRDHRTALGWINIAIALASQLDESEDRAFSTVFQQNGRALVEGHLGNAERALALVTNGLERLDHELGEDAHGLHRSVLRHNRAQVLKGLGRLAEARRDYETVITLDPNYAEYHFEYAGLLRRLGEPERALAEYERAMELTPPFVELYYNRGDLRAVRGDVDGALADFGYVLDLDPDYVDAHVNRAALLLALGDAEHAAGDIAAGLALDPAHPHLRCQHARMTWEDGEAGAARTELDALLADAPELAEAWALRAAVRFDAADLPGALADIGRALELEDTAIARYNRGAVFEALARWSDAAADYTQAIALDPGDPDAWLRRADCRCHLGDITAARSDLRQFAALAPDRTAEASAVLPDWDSRDRAAAAAV